MADNDNGRGRFPLRKPTLFSGAADSVTEALAEVGDRLTAQLLAIEARLASLDERARMTNAQGRVPSFEQIPTTISGEVFVTATRLRIVRLFVADAAGAAGAGYLLKNGKQVVPIVLGAGGVSAGMISVDLEIIIEAGAQLAHNVTGAEVYMQAYAE